MARDLFFRPIEWIVRKYAPRYGYGMPIRVTRDKGRAVDIFVPDCGCSIKLKHNKDCLLK